MTSVVVALDSPHAAALAEDLRDEGLRVVAICAPEDIDAALLEDADAVLLPATRDALSRRLLAACDRARVRVVPVGGDERRLLARMGLPETLPASASAREIVEVLGQAPAVAQALTTDERRVIAVWGAHGAPGRSTVAIQLAVELAGRGRQVCLVDADTHAPALALLLGLGDEAPGIAAACRRAETGDLDETELARLSSSVSAGGRRIDVLAGLNRPSRWPELSAHRLRAALMVCRSWADDTVVDIAAATESDEELSFDLTAPRRNAATIAALTEADAIVAVAAADPLGIARFLQASPEVRAIAGATPLLVAVNRVRPGPLGVDARGQIRRTLDRFAGIREVHFLPDDARTADAALLHARPMAEVSRRTPMIAAVRRLAAALPATAGSSPESSPAARSPRR